MVKISNNTINFVLTTQCLMSLFSQVEVSFALDVDGEVINEGVELDFENELIMVETSPVESKTQAIIVHDVTEVKFSIL